MNGWMARICGASAICLLAGLAAAADLPRELTSQLAPALERTREVYTRVSVFGSLRREMPLAHQSVEQDFALRVSGVRIRLDLTTVANNGTSARVGATDLYMATSIGSLVTMRAPGETVFHDARELKYGETKDKIQNTCHINDVYSFGGKPTVLDFLKQPSVSAVKMTSSQKNGQPLLKIAFREITGREDASTTWQSYVVLSPTEGWAIREYQRTSGSGDHEVTYRARLTYGGVRERVPIVDQIEYVEQRGKQKQVVLRESIRISQFLPGEPPEELWTAFDF